MASVFPFVASNVLFAAVLVSIAIVVTKVWRNPQLAHALWALVLIKLISPPLAVVAVPKDWFLTSTGVKVPTALADLAEGQSTNVDESMEPVASEVSRPKKALDGGSASLGKVNLDIETPTSNDIARATSWVRLISFAKTHWLNIVGTAWCLGVVTFSLVLIWRFVRFKRVLAASADATPDIRAAASRLTRSFGLQDCPEIRVVAAPIPPLVCCFGINPIILLSTGLLRELNEAQRNAVIAHELAHVRRRDHFIRWLELVSLVAFWWNPTAWYASRKLREAEEECCDAWVICMLPDQRRNYGQAMFRTIEFLTDYPRPHSVLGSAFGSSFHRRRIEMILNHKYHHTAPRRAKLGFLAVAAAILPLAAVLTSHATAESGRHDSVTEFNGSPEADQPGVVEGGTITGIVVDAEGKTVIGASAWIVHDAGRKIASTGCDPDGRFRFDGVAAGRVTVVAWSKGHSFTAANYPLQEGQPLRGITLTLEAPGELRLKIGDEEKRVVQGAALSALGVATGDTSAVWPPIDVLKHITNSDLTSDEEGQIRINGVPESAICEGSVKHADYAKQAFSDAKAGRESTSIRLDRGHPITIVAINGDTGRPAREATVTITGQPWTVNVYDEAVDENGELKIRLPKAEGVFIRVRHPELIAPRVEFLRSFPGKASFTAVLQPRVNLQVTALDEHGAPAPGVVIGLLSRREGAVVAKHVTGSSGSVTFEVPKGQNTLEVLAGRGYAASDERKATVNTEEAESTTLHVKRLPTVKGRVVLSNGETVANALVQDATMSRGNPLLTDQDGRFEYILSWRRSVTHARATASHLTEPVSGGAAISIEELELGQELVISLAPESEIYGNAVTPEGTPAAGAQLWLESAWTFGNWKVLSTYGSTATNHAGDYRFPGLSRHMHYRVLKAPRERHSRTSVRFVDLTTDSVRKNKVIRSVHGAQRSEESTLGEEAPELSCQGWVNSLPLDLNALRGKVVLIDFWAVWCGPCITELPQVQMAQDVFSDKGAVVIGLHDNSRSVAEVTRFAEANQLTFPIGVDTTSGETHARYKITGWPTKILVDRSGRVVSATTSSNWLPMLRVLVLHGEQ